MTEAPSRVSISPLSSPLPEKSPSERPESNTLLELARSDGRDKPFPPVEGNLSDLSGPASAHEAPQGHVYELADDLDATEDPIPSEDVYQPFPEDVPRVPVPNDLLDSLDDLTGSAVRLAVVLLEGAAAYDEQRDQWRTSPRRWTLTRLQCRRGLSMSRPSARNAARELEDAGLVDVDRSGTAHTYRWSPSTPDERYTCVPLALLREHSRLSARALTVLLSVYRATWGWTRKLGGEREHRLTASLSASDLKGMTGLSTPTIREARRELEREGAVHRERPPGRAAYWTVLLSFFHNPRQKSYTPDNYGTTKKRGEEVCNLNTRARCSEQSTEAETGKCSHSDGRARGEDRTDTALSEREMRDVKRLTAKPFDLPFWLAANLVSRRSAEVVQSTFGAYERQSEQIESPGGWIRAALEQIWFTPAPEYTPPKNLEGDTASGGWDFALTHSELTDAVDALSVDLDWETVGPEPRFVPERAVMEYLERWAGQMGSDRAEKWARRLISIRREYEQRQI